MRDRFFAAVGGTVDNFGNAVYTALADDGTAWVLTTKLGAARTRLEEGDWRQLPALPKRLIRDDVPMYQDVHGVPV